MKKNPPIDPTGKILAAGRMATPRPWELSRDGKTIRCAVFAIPTFVVGDEEADYPYIITAANSIKPLVAAYRDLREYLKKSHCDCKEDRNDCPTCHFIYETEKALDYRLLCTKKV